MQQIEKLFLGSTPSDQRQFITPALSYLTSKGSDHIVIPAVGQFALAKCAIEAGFPPATIATSDISFFTSALGYFYSGRPLADLPFRVADQLRIPRNGAIRPAAEYERLDSEPARLAYPLWLIQQRQIRRGNSYQRLCFDELVTNAARYRELLAAQLSGFARAYQGIRYEARDLRDVIAEPHPETTVMLLNPPIYHGGYKAMFIRGQQARGLSQA